MSEALPVEPVAASRRGSGPGLPTRWGVELPDGWQECRLGDLFENRKERGSQGLPTLSVTMNNGLVDREEMDRKQESALSAEEHRLVKAGDIAYNTMRMWQGAFGLANVDGIVSPAYVVLKPRETVRPEFAAYMLEAPRLKHRCWAYSYGLTEDRLRLYFEDFAKIPAWIPSLEVQGQVIDALRVWDRAIHVTAGLCAITEKQVSLERMHLVRRLAADKATRIASLDEVAKLVSGGTPDTSCEEYWMGSTPWITAKDMKGFRVDRSELSISEAAQRRLRTVPANAVLVLVRGMTLMRRIPVSLTSRESTFNQDVKAVLPSPVVDSEFLAHVLLARQPELLASVETAGHGTGRLDTRVLCDVEVPVPAIEVQQRVARSLSLLEAAAHAYARRLAQLKHERTALIRLLTQPRWSGSRPVEST
ncbi:MAG: restriction endonuclease subunit S [Burkholderiales bacterium]